ncbi:TPA: hypothetical protein KNT04_002608 [Clostridioides difficile]|nr:hypothetical protein [Clostridioides difficile]
MIKDCLEVFEKKLLEEGIEFIFEDYRLSDSAYIIVNSDGSYNVFIVNENLYVNSEEYKNIVQKDYLSKTVSSNKSIKSKRIMSNSYLSFITKKKFIDVLGKDIDEYFNVFITPEVKYNSKYEKDIISNWHIDSDKVNNNKVWIKNNLIDISKELLLGPEVYIKIFFEEDRDEYKLENEKYLILNVFNSNEYCNIIDNEILGVPNNNLTLNSKKPFLLNRTRKNKLPFLLTYEDAYLEKLFFDYLEIQYRKGNNIVYINENEIIPVKNDTAPEGFSGYMLIIGLGKTGAEILNCDMLVGYQSNIEIEFNDTLNRKTYILNTLDMLENRIDKIFFNGYLKNNYFNESINRNDSLSQVQSRELNNIRDAIFRLIYLNSKTAFKSKFKRSFDNIIKDTYKTNNNSLLYKQQCNLMSSLEAYFG